MAKGYPDNKYYGLRFIYLKKTLEMRWKIFIATSTTIIFTNNALKNKTISKAFVLSAFS